MEKKRNIILILIIVVLIVIMIIIFSIFNLNKKEDKTENNINDKIEEENTLNSEEDIYYYENNKTENQISSKLDYVKNRTDYFTVKSIADNYINILENKNRDALKNILSPRYMSNYHINDDNIFNILTLPKIEYRQYHKLMIQDMLKAQIDITTYIYIVEGKCRVVGGNAVSDIKIMIEIDTSDQTYNIYPQQYLKDNGIDQLKAGESFKNYIKEEIKDRQYNKVSYVTVSDQEIVNKYFENFTELLTYYQDDAYNKLNTEYSKKRFGSKKNFQDYLEKIKYTIYSMRINEYRIYNGNNYTDYICTDQYNNYYIFRQQGGIMRYSVFLDSYTVELDTFKQNYEKADENTKVAIQVGKFKQMLNTKDYNAIYHKLNIVFKNNNFNTVTKLENYLKNNVYDINTIEIEDFNQNNDYYVCNCILTNPKNTKEQKKITIIMKLIDSNNFEMSFNINE